MSFSEFMKQPTPNWVLILIVILPLVRYMV